MSTHLKRLRRMPRYNHATSPILAVIHSLAREYHCTVLESRAGIAIRRSGVVLRLGTVADVKSMTLRGLIGRFEEITQDWRYEAMNPVGHTITPISKSETRDDQEAR
jgi:hypothetical protein